MARSIRVTVVRDGRVHYPPRVRCGKDVAKAFVGMIGDSAREHFVGVYLDSRHAVLGFHEVSVGTADQCLVHPREVFLPAVHLSAVAIVVAHNHPSGDPNPSPEDRALTERLKHAGELLGIEVLDHIVVGDGKYYSFAEGAVMPYDL